MQSRGQGGRALAYASLLRTPPCAGRSSGIPRSSHPPLPSLNDSTYPCGRGIGAADLYDTSPAAWLQLRGCSCVAARSCDCCVGPAVVARTYARVRGKVY
jgi:hypothetical protein